MVQISCVVEPCRPYVFQWLKQTTFCILSNHQWVWLKGHVQDAGSGTDNYPVYGNLSLSLCGFGLLAGLYRGQSRICSFLACLSQVAWMSPYYWLLFCWLWILFECLVARINVPTDSGSLWHSFIRLLAQMYETFTFLSIAYNTYLHPESAAE